MPTWEKVDVPIGTYIGWGVKPKQHVTGTVLDYDPTGGTDFNDNVCPLLEVELTERAASFNKELERTNYEAGETVFLTCGLTSLKRAVKKAEPRKGDLIKIELEGLEKVDKGKVKVFGIQIARGAGKISEKAAAQMDSDGDDDYVPNDEGDDEPPF